MISLYSAAVFISGFVLIKIILYLKIFVLECEYQSNSLNTSQCSYNFFCEEIHTMGYF